MRVVPQSGGWIEVICGPMFSGKSEELMRRLTRAQIAGQAHLLLRPVTDTRTPADELVSHAGQRMESRCVADPAEIAELAGYAVIGIDEAQFFGPELVTAVIALAGAGTRVICAGLDMDYRCAPWPVMGELLARAEFVDKIQAVCMSCGGPATLTQRLNADGTPAGADGPLVQVGATDHYEARCRSCYRQAEG